VFNRGRSPAVVNTNFLGVAPCNDALRWAGLGPLLTRLTVDQKRNVVPVGQLSAGSCRQVIIRRPFRAGQKSPLAFVSHRANRTSGRVFSLYTKDAFCGECCALTLYGRGFLRTERGRRPAYVAVVWGPMMNSENLTFPVKWAAFLLADTTIAQIPMPAIKANTPVENTTAMTY